LPSPAEEPFASHDWTYPDGLGGRVAVPPAGILPGWVPLGMLSMRNFQVKSAFSMHFLDPFFAKNSISLTHKPRNDLQTQVYIRKSPFT
jgi:hypothetical protein